MVGPGISTMQGIFSFLPSGVCPHINHITALGRRAMPVITGGAEVTFAIFSH